MKIEHPKIGICGLSCHLCPMYHTEAKSRCLGCKSKGRMKVGCPFITCAIKQKKVEFCWDCRENNICEKWKNHRKFGNQYDTFKCYQRLDDNIVFIQKYGIYKFEKRQRVKEQLLTEMLNRFNEGRSKSHYCIIATVFTTDEITMAIKRAKISTNDIKDIKQKSNIFHSIAAGIAEKKGYELKLRKYRQ